MDRGLVQLGEASLPLLYKPMKWMIDERMIHFAVSVRRINFSFEVGRKVSTKWMIQGLQKHA